MTQIIISKQNENPKETTKVIEFNNVKFIHDFYTKRGFTDNQEQPVNQISLYVLRHDLEQEIKAARENQNEELLNRLNVAYYDLTYALEHHITKDDYLVYKCEVLVQEPEAETV